MQRGNQSAFLSLCRGHQRCRTRTTLEKLTSRVGLGSWKGLERNRFSIWLHNALHTHKDTFGTMGTLGTLGILSVEKSRRERRRIPRCRCELPCCMLWWCQLLLIHSHLRTQLLYSDVAKGQRHGRTRTTAKRP